MNQLKNIPLSSHEILDKLHDKCNVYIYNQLSDVDSLEDLISPHGCCVILYRTKPSFGHFTCIVRLNSGIISCFDSAGVVPDKELSWTNMKMRKKLNQVKPIIANLLTNFIDNGGKGEYNDNVIQAKNTMSCGYWCIVRITCKDMNNDQFIRWVKDNSSEAKMTCDDWICNYVALMK